MLPVSVFILPLSTYCGSKLPKSIDVLTEGTGEGAFGLLSLRILQKISTLYGHFSFRFCGVVVNVHLWSKGYP